MDANELKKKLSSLPVVEPDADEKRVLQAIDDTDEGTELEAFKTALEYSGRLSLRIPKSLHHQLAEQAKREGVSLNQYALYKLTYPTKSQHL